MNRNEVTSIAFKSVAIYWIFVVATNFPGLMNIFIQAELFGFGNTPPYSYLLAGFFVALSVLLGFICIWILWKVANSLIRPGLMQERQTGLSGSATELMQSVLICMGFYFAIRSALDFPHQFALVSMQPDDNPARHLHKIELTMILVKFCFGCLLIAKPGQWVKALRSIGRIEPKCAKNEQ